VSAFTGRIPAFVFFVGDDRRIEWGHVHLFAPEQSALVDTGLVRHWDLKQANPL